MATSKNNISKFIPMLHTYFLTTILVVFSPISIIFSFKELLLGIIIGGGIYLICYIIKYLNNSKKNNKSSYKKNANISISTNYFSLLIYIPSTISEEVLLRSYLFYLTNIHLPLPLSVAINAVIFYCIHADKRRIELIFSAIIYCLIVLYTNNIFPSIIAHLTYNIIAFLLLRKSSKKT
jgi:membrane protease YdiL (CAAX protease family)